MKEKNIIKSIAIILSFILMFQYISAIIPFLESIAVELEFKDENNIEWIYETEVQENETTIAKNLKPKNKNGLSGEITIPEKVISGENEYLVVSIAKDAFIGCASITSIIVPASIKEIKENAFYGCTGITNINLPENLRNIENSAFEDCTSLEKIKIPKNVNEIKSRVFYNCTNLKIIEFAYGSKITNISDSFGTRELREFGRQYIFGSRIVESCDYVSNFISSDLIWYNDVAGDIADCIKVSEENNFTKVAANFVENKINYYRDNNNKYSFYKMNEGRSGRYSNLAYLLQGIEFSNAETITIPSTVKDAYDIEYSVRILGGKNKDNNYIEFIGHTDSNIEEIKSKNIEISDNIVAIDKNYFKGWNGTITIPNSVEYISEDAFSEHGENFKIKCNGSSYAIKYAIENNIDAVVMCKFNSDIVFERVCSQIEDKVNFLNYNEESRYFELNVEDIKKIKKLDITNTEADYSKRLTQDDIYDLANFPLLEEVIADYNSLQLNDFLCRFKTVSLKNNGIDTFNLTNKAIVNLEKLYLNNNNIEDLLIFNTLKERKNETSNSKLEIFLEGNKIEDITKINNVINEDNDLITVDLKNQKIGKSVYKKVNELGNISKLFNDLKDEKYNNNEEITYTTQNCQIDGENVIIDDEIDAYGNNPAKITINNGLLQGSEIRINSAAVGIAIRYDLKDEELTITPVQIYGEEVELKDLEKYGDNYAYLRYSVNENDKGYGEYKIYNGPIVLKYGKNKIKVKLFNDEMRNIDNGDTEYEVNIGEDKLHLNAVRKNGKIYIYSNANLKYSFEREENYKDYTGPINNSNSNIIYVKLNDTEIRELTVANTLKNLEDEYTIYDTKTGEDLIERDSETNIPKNSTNHLSEIFGVVKDSAKIYSFSQKRLGEKQKNGDFLLTSDENKIKEIDENITGVTQVNDKILVLKDNSIYEVTDTKELKAINNGSNIKLINGIYAVSNDNSIFKCDYSEDNLQYIKCSNFSIDNSSIIKIVSFINDDEELPYVLYENGSAKILCTDGTFLEVSNRALDISSMNDKVYALEYDRIKSLINPLERNIVKESNKATFSNLLQENELPLKINNKGCILTNKGNVISSTKKDNLHGKYEITINAIKVAILDFNLDDELKLNIEALRNSIGFDPEYGEEVNKNELEEFLENINYNATLTEEDFYNLCGILKILTSRISIRTKIRIYKQKTKHWYFYNIDTLKISKTNIEKIGDNTFETSNGEIFYEVERNEIINEGTKEEEYTNKIVTENVQANKLIEDILVSKDESKLNEDKVVINITVPENKYKIKLPSGKEIEKSTSFEVTKNGVYTIEFTDKDGYTAIRVVHVTNIEKRKQTKVPVVVAVNGKIKLESNSPIEYSIDEKKTWKSYTDEITYTSPIYAKVKDDNYECSIIKITIDNVGRLEVYSEENRQIQSRILTNAIGETHEGIANDEKKIIKFAKDIQNIWSRKKESNNKNLFTQISEIAENIIYSFSVTDKRYSGCYFAENVSEITYKDLDNNVISIDMNESIQNLSKTKDQIDYGIIRDNYKDEKYNGDYKAFKTEVKNYAYLSNDGKIVSDLKVLEYAKKQIGENKKYVKLVGEGATFYILTEEGEVYIATESKNFAERYFSRKLNSMDERTLPIGSSEKTLDYYIVYKVETKDIVDIFDTNTALNKNGEIISLLYPNKNETSIVQEIQKQTDKFLLATRLGLKDGKLYNFNNVHIENNRVLINEQNLKESEVKKGKLVKLEKDENDRMPKNTIGIYSEKDKTFKRLEDYRDVTLNEGEYYVGVEEDEGKLPEFVDIAEYRDSYLLNLYKEQIFNGSFKIDKYYYADYYTISIALSKDGEIYLYTLDSNIFVEYDKENGKTIYPQDTRTGYVIDTGINLDYYGPSANFQLDNTNWTNEYTNLKFSGNTTNEIANALVKKDGSEIANLDNTDDKKIQDKQVKITVNGEYEYVIKDKRNRTYSGTVKVSNIDKLKPITPEIKNQEGKLKVNFKDDKEATKDYAKSGIKARYISFDKTNWQLVKENETLVEVAEEQILYAKTIDNAGNESDIAAKSYKAEFGNVVVMYQDLDGNKLLENVTLTGEVGKAYKTEKIEISGYEFKEVVGKETGKFAKEEQVIIYKYKKIEETKPEPNPQAEIGKVIAKYQDENGNSIKDDVTLTGKVGTSYKTEKAEFEVYEFVEVEGKEEGKFEKEEQVVIYKYNKKSGRIIIIYHDPDGVKIKENDTITGKIDSDYKVKRQVIDGYELIEVIGNEEGKYKLADQFVSYKYKKIEKEVVIPQTGQSRIAYLVIGIVIIISICGLIYIKWDDLKNKNKK